MPHVHTQPLVLLVEDYHDTRELYAYYLTVNGYRVEQASDGLIGLEKATRFVPDLILMDLSLPGIDGWEATARLKRDTRTAHIPVVALTAHALAQEKARALATGCVAVVTKPCLPQDLVREVARVLTATPNQ